MLYTAVLHTGVMQQRSHAEAGLVHEPAPLLSSRILVVAGTQRGSVPSDC